MILGLKGLKILSRIDGSVTVKLLISQTTFCFPLQFSSFSSKVIIPRAYIWEIYLSLLIYIEQSRSIIELTFVESRHVKGARLIDSGVSVEEALKVILLADWTGRDKQEHFSEAKHCFFLFLSNVCQEIIFWPGHLNLKETRNSFVIFLASRK